MWYLVCAVIGYLVGTINPSYLIAQLKGFDIRKAGSGNAGASNALITMGNKIGAICMVLDIVKAWAVVTVILHLLPGERHAALLAGTMCIMGHMFPFYMHFKGGKGLACLGGCILAYSAQLFVIMLLSLLVLVLIVDYICIAPIIASIAFPIIYGIMEADWKGALIMSVATVAMLYKHVENLKRIANGTEAHFSYIWKKDEETERVKRNLEGRD